jgi:coproporphyrinogen III oxidase
MLIHARSDAAHAALAQVERWQARFVTHLTRLHTSADPFAPVHWLRDGGRHGGGTRFVSTDTALIQRGSVNVSQVHYDDLPDKALASATALSTIIHPTHPRAPSVHIHVSWTALRAGRCYWRLMADLNPAIPHPADTLRFAQALEAVAGETYAEGQARGDRYFFIPALDRHRGATHFYLEGWHTDDPIADATFADRFACAAIDTYSAILEDAVQRAPAPTAADHAAQLAYHTLYLFQVLTLDRGTTSGLLVHDQNDVGIMGSLPARVDAALLRKWRERVPAVQRSLVDGLVDAVTAGDAGAIDAPTKKRLAQTVRAHYRAHPEALKLQASGGILPPTVANHR